MAAANFPEAPDRDLFQLAEELLHLDGSQLLRVVNPDPVSYSQGRKDDFWLVDLMALQVYKSQFELRHVTDHAYWYVEAGQTIGQEELVRAAANFEANIYPKITDIFGQEWTPGVDNDVHLNVVNAKLRGVAGYYSSSDEYPVEVSKNSNQRETIYINTQALPVNSQGYLNTLGHELQHAVHWNADRNEETWVNEGLSELASALAGYEPVSIHHFLRSPTTSLVHWPLSPSGSGPNYGAAFLFMHYLVEHYGDFTDLRPLLSEPADGKEGINAYLAAQGTNKAFGDVFGEWAIANLLDQGSGRYAHSNLDVGVTISKSINGTSRLHSKIPQYSVEYVEITDVQGPLRIAFEAPATVELLPVEVDSRGCWWGNSGDGINATLSHELDLRPVDGATLNYQIWHSIEENWDYVYLELSVDGGGTWTIVETPYTSPQNPVGTGFGPGYTGDSAGWIDESVDLTSYVGRQVLLRFQYVTDDAINGSGVCLRGLSVPEISLSELSNDWLAAGFIHTNNLVKQDYIVQIVEGMKQAKVTRMALDENNSGELAVVGPKDQEQLVVVVAALAPKTRQPASYTLRVESTS